MYRLLPRILSVTQIRPKNATCSLNRSIRVLRQPIVLRNLSTAASESLEESQIEIESAKDQLEHIREEEEADAVNPLFKPDRVLNFGDLRKDVYDEILNPDAHRGVQSKDLPLFNQILKGHRRGELTILTGPTGFGKTTVISQLSLDYCRSGVPTLWGSFEILNKRLAKKMLSQFAEKDLAQFPEEFDRVADEFEKLPMYFLKFHSSTPIKKVLDVCKEAVDVYGVQHIVIDNLQFMLSQQARAGLDKWELQEDAIAKIRSFATSEDVHITLVVHPRKETGEELDINSIFGSAKVTQEADNVIILQRRFNTRAIDIKKNRYDGTLGVIKYKFNKNTLKIEEVELEDPSKRVKQSSMPFVLVFTTLSPALTTTKEQNAPRMETDGLQRLFNHLLMDQLEKLHNEALHIANCSEEETNREEERNEQIDQLYKLYYKKADFSILLLCQLTFLYVF
ncbi:hypothetical protein G6F46_008184 [Rhizopus delemar]|uniref:SF4 helicase domain-containing protein n=2 Tax=Rhizopus TaxID=4842 RepID=A0A9P7CMP7_9FUNG|nr:hypothetical protein G6F55_003076 [Rhizopus delemar]KAG1552992.1 hypothetical protein G6F51_000866 [Rhizopus arrhizus]KAG1495418.1 hypothetical protein G6F54_007187 [Rhizopus delemar]KAG1508848.1 hypothetical protein G6F53_007886 [Rhizopus delemar]KAG1520461.1 hypothetical protein G6F52_007644 [Rhizopus delemar]